MHPVADRVELGFQPTSAKTRSSSVASVIGLASVASWPGAAGMRIVSGSEPRL
jgi:hypothetical protein